MSFCNGYTCKVGHRDGFEHASGRSRVAGIRLCCIHRISIGRCWWWCRAQTKQPPPRMRYSCPLSSHPNSNLQQTVAAVSGRANNRHGKASTLAQHRRALSEKKRNGSARGEDGHRKTIEVVAPNMSSLVVEPANAMVSDPVNCPQVSSKNLRGYYGTRSPGCYSMALIPDYLPLRSRAVLEQDRSGTLALGTCAFEELRLV